MTEANAVSQDTTEPADVRPMTGEEYYKRAIGVSHHPAVLGKYKAAHPVTIRRIYEEALTRFPEAADVLAALVFFDAVRKNLQDFSEKERAAEEARAKAHEARQPLQFDALVAKLKADDTCANPDVADLLAHALRMREALLPFARLASALGEGTGVTIDQTWVSASEFAAAVAAVDAMPRQGEG